MLLSFAYCDNATHKLLSSQVRISDRKKANLRHVGLCVLGYCANWFPYFPLVARPTYMYHYHPSLYFGILAIALMYDVVCKGSPLRKVPAGSYLLLAAIVLPIGWAYWQFLPLSYYWPMTRADHNSIRWFKSFFYKW